MHVLGESRTVAETVQAIHEEGADIVFLDIALPDGAGLDVIHQVGAERMPMTVFVSPSRHAFHVDGSDHIGEPADEDRRKLAIIQSCGVEFGRECSADDGLAQSTPLVAAEGSHRYVDRIVVRVDGGFGFVRADEVDWIEAANNCVRLHQGSKTWLLRRPLTSLESDLDPQRFLRVHRSAIVNIGKVRLVRVYSGVEYILSMEGGASVLTGRAYRERVRTVLLRQTGSHGKE